MRKDVILKKSPNIVTRIIEDEVILMPLYKTSKDIDCIYTLNDVGARIWGLIGKKKTLAEIKKILLKEFDATEEDIDKKLSEFLKELAEIKAVI
jgi:hypothetical protein